MKRFIVALLVLTACGQGRLSPQGGTVTAVNGGSGMTGGGTGGSVTLNVVGATGGGISVGADSISLDSTGCASGQVPTWNGTTWGCADPGETYTAGDGLVLVGTTFSANLAGASCTGNTVMTALGATGTGTCAAPPNVTSSVAGYAPASGGGTSNFLRADGTWSVPPGTNTTTITGASGVVLKSDGAGNAVASSLSDDGFTVLSTKRVAASVTSGTAGLIVDNGSKSWTLIPQGNDLRFHEYTSTYGVGGGNVRLTLQAGGNVGIGDVTPDYLLDVAGTFGTDGDASIGGTVFALKDGTGIEINRAANNPATIDFARTGATALGTGTQILNIRTRGTHSTGTSSNVSAIGVYAAESWTSTAQGTYLSLFTTPNGSTASAEAVRVGSDAFDVNASLFKFGPQDGAVYFIDNQINGRYAVNATDSLVFNYNGYNGGATQFRDAKFYDGKNVLACSITGSTKTLNCIGGLQVNGTSVPAGTGTALSLAKWTGTNTLGNSTITDAGSNVTIATATYVQVGSSGLTPNATDRLRIESSSTLPVSLLSTSQKSIYFGNADSSTDGGIEYDRADYLGGMAFRVGSGIRMAINDNGTTGIGTNVDVPKARLHVRGFGGSSGLTPSSSVVSLIENTAANSYLGFLNNTNAMGIEFGNGTSATDGRILYDTSRNMVFRAGSADRCTISGTTGVLDCGAGFAIGGTPVATTSNITGTVGRSARITAANTVGTGAFTDDGTNVSLSGNFTITNSSSFLMGDNSTHWLKVAGNSTANFIESGTDSTSGSALPLKFTSMNAAATWAQFDASGNFTAFNAATITGLLTATAGVTTPSNLTTTGAGDLVSGDDLTVADAATILGLSKFGATDGASAYFSGGVLNFRYGVNGTATGYINGAGYQDGTTATRSLQISDGTGTTTSDAIAFFDGTDRSVTLCMSCNRASTFAPTGTTIGGGNAASPISIGPANTGGITLGSATNNVLIPGSVTINGTGSVSSWFQADNVYAITGFAGARGTNADAVVHFNPVGYNNGTSQFRDLQIDDGKGSALGINSIAYFDGSTKGTTLYGSLIVNTDDLTVDTTLHETSVANLTSRGDTELGTSSANALTVNATTTFNGPVFGLKTGGYHGVVGTRQQWWDEFYGPQTASNTGTYADGFLKAATTSGGTITIASPGSLKFSPDTTAGGRAYLANPVSNEAITMGAGGTWTAEEFVTFDTLSDGSPNYWFIFGFADQTTLNQTDGCWFQYDNTNAATAPGTGNANSATTDHWEAWCASGGVRTGYLLNGTTVCDGGFTSVASPIDTAGDRLKIVYAGATEADFYLNDVKVCQITTNLPSGANKTGPMTMGAIISGGAMSFSVNAVNYLFETALERS